MQIEVVRCQRCAQEVVDYVSANGPHLTHRRQEPDGREGHDRMARAHNLHLKEGEDVVCMDCIRKGFLYRATH